MDNIKEKIENMYTKEELVLLGRRFLSNYNILEVSDDSRCLTNAYLIFSWEKKNNISPLDLIHYPLCDMPLYINFDITLNKIETKMQKSDYAYMWWLCTYEWAIRCIVMWRLEIRK